MKDIHEEGTTASRLPFRMVRLSRPTPVTQKRPPKLLLIIGGVLLLVVVWQLAYPRDQALPLARLDGTLISGKNSSAIADMITGNYDETPVNVQVASETYDATAQTIGLSPDTTLTTERSTAYALWQRFVPLSIFVAGFMNNHSVATTLDETSFSAFAKTLQDKCAIAVEPARLQLDGGSVTVEPAKDGQACSEAAIRSALEGIELQREGVDATVAPETVVAPGKDASTDEAVAQAEQIAGRNLVLSVDGFETSVPKDTIIGWLTLPYDDEKYSVATDTSAIRTYVETAQKDVYVAPGVTKIHNTKDGTEQSRESGATGTGLDVAVVTDALATTLLNGGGTVLAESIVLAPNVEYDNPYTPDRTGLQQLLDDLVKNKGDVGIALQTANGNLILDSNGSKQYKPASTYKMIVAWAILKRIDAGKLGWNDAAVNGLSVSECFDTMIINSDNPCAEYFGEKVIGWRNLNAMALELGMTCSDWNAKWYSCAQDEALFLQKLQSGDLLNETQLERLLSVMRVQAFRQGIPYGVSWTVADKVGFLNGLLHDAAIVYAPTGTYALVIMTDNSSWAEIADAAWQIDAQLARMSQ